MTQSTPKYDLKAIYTVIDWLDLGLVGALIWYYSRLFRSFDPSAMAGGFNYAAFMQHSVQNTTALGIFLLLASLAICTVFIVLTVKMRRARQISSARAAVRMAWNFVWIPFDLFYLFLIFTHLFTR